ncbi:choline-binding transcriptional repressor BetI [Aquicoccus porphyridii]|uniref:HTH-type transcriptional regulator BetI n=1 Tax=Aquicoccus porphyridii TaxID=1852029 RepID=A0A5A9ZUH8_9RHOB|nr:transcriptional regulator BetI [Aquicoccus porphyridii]KAA0920761.1 transcriptional regulator BetI [Aquicoccus porphyridii]RAI56690.1 transcriptional regulator BetI [Rhodobacteraceae bacterium AsT-22]
MPKLGMEPIRREALVKATIAEIGEHGTLGVTVSQIARRAGMSSALAHHYFGGKEQIFVAAMRYTMGVYAAEVRGALVMATGPAERVEAVVRASFSPRNFRADTVAAWLNFYVLAQVSDEARRLLDIYHRRIRSNLCHALRDPLGARAWPVAERVAALIDGVYLRQSLGHGTPDGDAAVEQVMGYARLELERAPT